MASIDRCTAEDLSEIELRVLLYSSDGVWGLQTRREERRDSSWLVKPLMAKFKAKLVREATVSSDKELSNSEG